MSNYDRQHEQVLRLLSQRGTPLRVLRLKRGRYNPARPSTVVAQVELDSPGHGIILPSIIRALREFDDYLLVNPDHTKIFRAGYIAARGLTFEPNIGDLVVFPDGLMLRIVGRVILNPTGDKPLLYTVGMVNDVPANEILFPIPENALLFDGYGEDAFWVDENGQHLTPDL